MWLVIHIQLNHASRTMLVKQSAVMLWYKRDVNNDNDNISLYLNFNICVAAEVWISNVIPYFTVNVINYPRNECSRALPSLRWHHNGYGGVSNHQPHDCLLNRLFRHRSKKTSKLRVTGLCAGNSPGTGEFPAQRASYAENVFIWWRHHDVDIA